MNAETVDSILEFVENDLERSNVLTRLQELVVALEGQVASPSDASAQQNVANAYTSFLEASASSSIDTLSPAWRKSIRELGFSEVVGQNLAERVKAVIERNGITPAIALDECRTLYSQLDGVNTGIKSMTTLFQFFRIGEPNLDPGTAVVGFTIPRPYVNEELTRLGEELRLLNRILDPFNELAIGSRPEILVASISSSDFSVVVHLSVKAAEIVAAVWLSLQHVYKEMLDIRLIKKQLEGLEFVDSSSKVEEEATGRVTQEVGRIVTDVLETYGGGIEEGRRNELNVALNWSVTRMADRIDHGVTLEVRAGDPPSPVEGEGGVETQESVSIRDGVEKLRMMSGELEGFEMDGEPILELGEPLDQD